VVQGESGGGGLFYEDCHAGEEFYEIDGVSIESFGK